MKLAKMILLVVWSLFLFSQASVKAEVNCSTINWDPPVALSVGVTVNDTICQGFYQQYNFSVTSGNRYTVTLSPGFTSDPDLYLHQSSVVSPSNYTYSSTSRGSAVDSYTFTASNSGAFYAAVYGYAGEASGKTYYSIKVEEIVSGNSPSTPTINTPVNGALLEDSTPDLSWSSDSASYFHVQIATDPNFNNIVCNDDRVGSYVYTPGDQYCSPLAGGEYWWRVRAYLGAWSGWAVSSFTIKSTSSLNPTVSVSPSSGFPGTTFQQPGSGFTPNNSVTLFFKGPDGTSTSWEPTDSNGNYSHSWTCNACPVGTYEYWAVDQATGTSSHHVSFTIDHASITPTVSVSPAVGYTGTTFQQSGEGFTPNSLVELYFNGPDGESVLTKTTDAAGAYSNSWSCNQCPVGQYSYYALDKATGIQSNVVYFTIAAAPISPNERNALIALYNSTNGDNWIHNDGWKTPPLHTDGFARPGTEDSWYGITVNGGTVNTINMWDNNLVGSI